jgi:hypothetical protein
MLPAVCRQWSWDVIQRLALEDLRVVEEAKAKGATPVSWTSEEKARVRKEARKVWDDWRKKNEDCKKALDSMEAFLRKLGKI